MASISFGVDPIVTLALDAIRDGLRKRKQKKTLFGFGKDIGVGSSASNDGIVLVFVDGRDGSLGILNGNKLMVLIDTVGQTLSEAPAGSFYNKISPQWVKIGRFPNRVPEVTLSLEFDAKEINDDDFHNIISGSEWIRCIKRRVRRGRPASEAISTFITRACLTKESIEDSEVAVTGFTHEFSDQGDWLGERPFVARIKKFGSPSIRRRLEITGIYQTLYTETHSLMINSAVPFTDQGSLPTTEESLLQNFKLGVARAVLGFNTGTWRHERQLTEVVTRLEQHSPNVKDELDSVIRIH